MVAELKNRKLLYSIVDVFGSEKYSGNQLAVFTEIDGISGNEMQKIALELNFSETSFITGYNLDLKVFDVRIFTPHNEVPFAGHPTLGTAFIANHFFLDNKADSVFLNLQVGKIPVRKEGEIIWMNQVQPKFGELFQHETISSVLSLNKDDIDTELPIQIVSTGLPFILVPLKNLDALKRATLDLSRVRELLKGSTTKEIMVFTRGTYDNSHQLAARVFVPEFGIPEDAATGSANGCLSAYLLKYNVLEKNAINLVVAQGYEMNRPSKIYHRSSLEKNKFNINIGGKVVPIAEGVWY
jgi:trans-2,3-dihydro-3-hydroxyanthranilate isomerase